MKAKTQHSSPWKGISWRKVTRTVDRREAGTYEISELLREFWPWEKRPHLYGRVFKWLVLQGWFDRVRWAGERSKALYRVVPPARKPRRTCATCRGRSHG